MLLRRAACFASVCVLLVGCRHDDLTVPGATAVARPQALAVAIPKRLRPEEQHFADLAAKSPSSAGYFIDSAGQMVVQVVDPADDGLARAAAAPSVSVVQARSPRTHITNIAIRRAKYTFWQLAAWRDKVSDELMGRSSVISRDLDERANRVAVGVRRSLFTLMRDSLMRSMSRLGIDTLAVDIRPDDPVTLATGTASSAKMRRRHGSTLNTDVDTIVGGIKFFRKWHDDTTHTSWCTIGTVVDYDGVRGFLTASHCTATMFTVDSQCAYKASGGDARIGIERTDPSGFGCNVIYTCRGTDVAFYGLHSP
ncbi:MAG: hypothetical protein IT356_03240 [Gemmatimonadaceae bacterium]|nr:hypothetical protein [Gemmatimonadaceae bacterium]